MKMLHPTLCLDMASHLGKDQLARWGVRGLILDIDNTLTSSDNPIPNPEALSWVEDMKIAGIKMVILSNNHLARVSKFAELLGLDYIAKACKPLTGGFKRACEKLDIPKEEIAVVGDQIFTDIFGGNRAGCVTILVDSLFDAEEWYIKIKRVLELPFKKPKYKK